METHHQNLKKSVILFFSASAMICSMVTLCFHSRTKKMAQMMDLPFEMLQAILTFLATSCDGARDLARASAACKRLMTVARQPDVLRVVSFQNVVLTDVCQEHHVNGLLLRCARTGNLAAECLLGKALLQRMCSELDYHTPMLSYLSSGQLQHRRLVRSFIQCGSPEDLIDMRYAFCKYIAFSVGLGAPHQFRFFRESFFYDIARFERSGTRDVETQASPHPLVCLLAELQLGSPTPTPREQLLVFFDRVFPSKSHVT